MHPEQTPKAPHSGAFEKLSKLSTSELLAQGTNESTPYDTVCLIYAVLGNKLLENPRDTEIEDAKLKVLARREAIIREDLSRVALERARDISFVKTMTTQIEDESDDAELEALENAHIELFKEAK